MGKMNRAYRRYMRQVKIRKRKKSCNCFKDMHTGMIADTPKPCSSPACCGNYRLVDGPTIQERRSIVND